MIIRETKTRNIISKSNLPVCDYSANPYTGCTNACRYCYASFMKRFTNHPENWGDFLDVKYWLKISSPQKYAGKEIFVGSVTDPYLPEEKQYCRTRTLLEELAHSGAQISIQTKSDLVLRDLELIKSIPDIRVGFSINTLDERFKNDMDRGISIARRIRAMQTLHDAGVRTTCFISPIFPGITDIPAIINEVKSHCNLIWLENLNLRGAFKADIMNYIAECFPMLMPLYLEIYQDGGRGYWNWLDEQVRAYAADTGLKYVHNDDSFMQPFSAPPVIVNFFFHNEIKKSAQIQDNS